MKNYEKKYNEAFERAKTYYNTTDSAADAELIELIFPEVKVSDDEKIRKEIIEFFENCNIKHLDWIAWIKKQGEQNTINNVKSKFNPGDWIVFNGFTLYVKEIVNGFYRTISRGGITNSYDLNIDNAARLWTIQDAKDGDVLVVNRDNSPFIFKGFDKFHPECPVAYCGIDDNGIFIVNSGDGWWTDERVEPATKEQYELLFQKMKEAGYTWDSNKLELKKIEQKSKSNDDITCNKNKLIKDICKWLKNYANSYINSEHNGTIDTDEMIKALKYRFET